MYGSVSDHAYALPHARCHETAHCMIFEINYVRVCALRRRRPVNKDYMSQKQPMHDTVPFHINTGSHAAAAACV